MTAALPFRRPDQLVVDRLVRELTGVPAKDLTDARARARSLPTMIRRHGPIQVLLFLESKGDENGSGSDRRLAQWLLAGIGALPQLGPEAPPAAYAKRLAGLPLNEYLFHWQTAVEVAAWLKRLVEARTHASTAAPNAEAAVAEATEELGP